MSGAGGFVFGAIVTILVLAATSGKPSSSQVDVSVYTDTRTGCQYLGAPTALTPRVDASGHHLCEGEPK